MDRDVEEPVRTARGYGRAKEEALQLGGQPAVVIRRRETSRAARRSLRAGVRVANTRPGYGIAQRIYLPRYFTA